MSLSALIGTIEEDPGQRLETMAWHIDKGQIAKAMEIFDPKLVQEMDATKKAAVRSRFTRSSMQSKKHGGLSKVSSESEITGSRAIVHVTAYFRDGKEESTIFAMKTTVGKWYWPL